MVAQETFWAHLAYEDLQQGCMELQGFYFYFSEKGLSPHDFCLNYGCCILQES
jgi:hypothetical protein